LRIFRKPSLIYRYIISYGICGFAIGQFITIELLSKALMLSGNNKDLKAVILFIWQYAWIFDLILGIIFINAFFSFLYLKEWLSKSNDAGLNK